MMLRTRIESRLLHALARAALRWSSPLRAKRIVDTVGRAMGCVRPGDAEDVLRALGASGTCLTRSLTVAARLEGAEVVILAVPARLARRGRIQPGDPPLLAHAWVEHLGMRIGDGGAEAALEVARLS